MNINMEDLDSEELYQLVKSKLRTQNEINQIFKNSTTQDYIYTQEEINCAKKFITFDVNNLNNWVSANFESDLNEKNILFPKIKGKWGAGGKIQKKFGIDISNLIFLSNEDINYKLVNNYLKSTVILTGGSEYWIFLHSKGKFDNETIAISFSKKEFSEAVFMSLGLFIKTNNDENNNNDEEDNKSDDQNNEYCFRVFHSMQLIRSYNKNESNNHKYDNNDSCMIKIIVNDEGKEEIKVSAWINEGDAENQLVGKFYKPIAYKTEYDKEIRTSSTFEINNKNYKVMIAGSGQLCKVTQFSCETNFKEGCQQGFNNCNCCVII